MIWKVTLPINLQSQKKRPKKPLKLFGWYNDWRNEKMSLLLKSKKAII